MASLTPNKPDDELNPTGKNPGQEDFDKIIASNFPDEQKSGGDDPELAAIRGAEQDPDGPAATDDHVGTQENRPYFNYKPPASGDEQDGSSKASGFSQQRRNQMALGLVTLGFIGGVGFFMIIPAFFLIQVKEVLLNKFDRLPSLQDARVNRIVSKQLSENPLTKGCGKIKVKCRYKGMSQKQIDKFIDRNGGNERIKIETEERRGFNKKRVKSITFTDSSGQSRKVGPSEIRRLARTNPDFQRLILNYNKSKVAIYRDKKWGNIRVKLKLFAGKVRSPRGPPQTREDIEKKQNDRREARQERQAKIKTKYRGTIKKARLVTTLCAIKGLVKVAKVAIKVTQAIEMAKLTHSIYNAADTRKSGEETEADITNNYNNIAATLTETDENGKTFADSFGYQYASTGALVDDGGNYKDYQLGVTSDKGVLAAISSASSQTSGLSAVTTAIDKVLNPVVCTAAGAIDIGFCFATGATYCIASVSTVQILLTVAMPIIEDKLIKTPDIDDAVGGNAGDAAVGGGSYLAKTNCQSRGCYPLSPDQAKEYDKFSDNAQGSGNWTSLPEALDPHDPNTLTGKLAAAFLPSAMRLRASASNIPTTLASLPSMGLSSLSSSSYARDFVKGEYDQCDDNDYKVMKVAADPFCVPQYGLDPAMVLGDSDYNDVSNATPLEKDSNLASFFSLPFSTASAANRDDFSADNRFDAEKVDEFLCGKSLEKLDDTNVCDAWINNEGEPIDYADKDDDLADYIKECAETTDPLQPSTDKMCGKKKCKSASSSSKEFRYCMFSQTNFDGGIRDQINDEDAGGPAPDQQDDGATTDETGAIPDGDSRDLARQIIDSKRVTGDSRYFSHVKDIADNKTGACYISPKILGFILAMSKKYKLHISSLNRRCTGTLTASGEGSLHYANKGGRAVDISIINGTALEDIKSGKAKQLAEGYFNDAAKILPKNAELGQINSCSLKVDTRGITNIVPDACNHVHIGIP